MEEKHSGIMIIIGTKAELIKCMPVMLELQKRNLNYWFVHTGQHPLKNSCRIFGVKEPDFIIKDEPKKTSKYWSRIKLKTFLECWEILFEIRKLIKELKPRYVIYHGDTMSTAMAAGASSKILNWRKPWKNVHLEAGLESGSIFEPFPEEFTRAIISRFTDILFAVSDLSEENLRKRKLNFVKRKIIKTGNTIIDSSGIQLQKAKKTKYKIPKEDFFLINIHRYENLKSRKRMKKIIEIIKLTNIKGIWPLHENTQKYLERYRFMVELKKQKNIEIVPLMEYGEFIFLMSKAKYIIADGGSIQEESLVFKKPCILLRKRTERREGLETGINFLTKLDTEYAKKIIELIENNKLKIGKFKNPYGEKGLSEKIVDLLVKDQNNNL